MRFALLILLLGQDGWWNNDWALRRKITIANRLKEPLKAGFPVTLDINPGFLGLDRKCQPGYADLRVVHAGKEVPFSIDPLKPDQLLITFKLDAEIKPKGADEYHLYYGNKDAKNGALDKTGLHEFFSEFNDKEDLKKFDSEGGLDLEVQNGKMIVRQKAAGESRLRFARLAPIGTFQFKLNFTADMQNAAGNAGDNQVTVHLRPKLQAAIDPKIEAKVAELVEKLGEDEYRVREEATKAIIELGKAAIAKIEKVFKETKDAEIKWRCEYILQEIAKNNPLQGISVTYTLVPGRPLMFTISSTIAGKTKTLPLMAAPAIELEITRMEKFGSVTIRTPAGQMANIGELKDEIEEVWLEFKNTQRTPILIDNALITRYLSEPGRPSTDIDIEESRK